MADVMVSLKNNDDDNAPTFSKTPAGRVTLEQSQRFADVVTDAEGGPRVRAFVFYPYLADSIGVPQAVAAYFPDTRIIYSRFETIEYRYLIHEPAHAVCDSRGRACGEGHGPGFVGVEGELFRKYPRP